MYRRFGAEVTVVEKEPRLIAREDEDVSEAIRDILEAEGIAVRTGAECIRFAPHGDGVAVGLDCDDGPPEVVGSHVLLAVGRRPEHRRSRPRRGRRRDRRARLHHGRRRARDQRARHLGARRLQRPRRLHPHRLQRFRDRRRQPARRRGAARSATASRPTRSTSIRRSAASGMTRDGGAQDRPADPGRQAADDARRPRHREGRDAGLHEDRRRRRDASRSSAPRSSAPAATRRSTASST